MLVILRRVDLQRLLHPVFLLFEYIRVIFGPLCRDLDLIDPRLPAILLKIFLRLHGDLDEAAQHHHRADFRRRAMLTRCLLLFRIGRDPLPDHNFRRFCPDGLYELGCVDVPRP